MKKFILNSLIAVVIFGFYVPASAEETVSSEANVSIKATTTLRRPAQLKTTIQAKEKRASSTLEAKVEMKARLASSTSERKENMQDRIQDRMEERKDKIASSTENRILKVREFLSKKYNKMLERIEATIERQERILSRINSRTQKVKTAGGNTSESEKFTAEAKLHIDSAESLLVTLKSTTAGGVQNIASTTGEVKKETMEKMREQNKNIEMQLKAAHKAMVNAITTLKGMSSTNASTTLNVTATSTATTTSN